MRRVRIAVLVALLASLITVGGAPAEGADEAFWGAWFTADYPAGFWAEGEYDFLYEFESSWTYPSPGDSGCCQQWPVGGPFTVSESAPLYPGRVLIRFSVIQALASFPPGPGGPECTFITSFHPDQPTRIVVGLTVDDPRTPDEAEPVTKQFAKKYLKSLTMIVTPVGGSPVELQQQELQGPFAFESDFGPTACALTLSS